MARRWRRWRPPRRLKTTREGRIVIILAIGIGLAAVNTGNNLLYLLLGWLLSMIIASGALSDVSLRGLALRRRAPLAVHAGRPFEMEIAIENLKPRFASYALEVEDLVAERPLDKRCFYLKIPPGRSQRAHYRHTFHRRGVYLCHGFRVATRFPFGLFRKSRDVDAADEILVYPEVRPIALPSPKSQVRGEAAQVKLGRRGEFFGLREYKDGDDRRAIHWKATARTGSLMVREHQEEAQQRVTLVLDNGLPVGADDDAHAALEAAVTTTASLAIAYLGAGYAVRLIARGSAVAWVASLGDQHRLLAALARLEASGPELAFAGGLDPRSESVLVARRGAQAADRPQASRVVEVG